MEISMTPSNVNWLVMTGLALTWFWLVLVWMIPSHAREIIRILKARSSALEASRKLYQEVYEKEYRTEKIKTSSGNSELVVVQESR
jgi:hypothetical protein